MIAVNYFCLLNVCPSLKLVDHKFPLKGYTLEADHIRFYRVNHEKAVYNDNSYTMGFAIINSINWGFSLEHEN